MTEGSKHRAFQTGLQRIGIKAIVKFLEICKPLNMLLVEVLRSEIEAEEGQPAFVAAKMNGSDGEEQDCTQKQWRERAEQCMRR